MKQRSALSFFPLIKINWQQILSHERRMRVLSICAIHIDLLRLLLLRLLMDIKRVCVVLQLLEDIKDINLKIVRASCFWMGSDLHLSLPVI